MAITVLGNQPSSFYSGKGRPALFQGQEFGRLDMRKHVTFALAALVFGLSLILFAAFNADETTASDTLRTRPGTQHAIPVNSFLGVRNLETVW